MKEFFSGALGFVAIGGMLALGIAQIIAGYAGIEHHLGAGWAIGALVVAFVFRFMLPIGIGAFFGAMSVWGWHWAAALVFAVPTLLFMIPGLIAAAVSAVRGR